MTKSDKLRMIQWLLSAFVFYALALSLHHPQLQTLCFKVGHVTLGSFIGYWIDRNLYSRLTDGSEKGRIIARAILQAACIWGLAGGL